MKIYVLALVVFLGIDMVWLGVVAKNFYRDQIGFLMRPDVNWVAAIIFYLIFIAGLVQFVIAPALDNGGWIKAVVMGMGFGLVTYATYDLTNLATVKNWPIVVTVVDLVWGMVLAGAVAGITVFLSGKLK